MKQSANLLVSLSKWASGQQENFLSDAFVHLMNVLAHDSPAAFAMVVENMSDGTIRPTGDSAEAFTLISQVHFSEGTPDIEIAGPGSYALVEVKDESPVDVDQIERYLKLVKESEAGSKCLVLLTRYQPPALPDSPLLKPVRWTQITEWLRSAEERFNFDETSIYTLRQFIGFLEAKGMSVNKAGWEMLSGIEQFANFKVLLQQAMESAGAHKVYAAYGADFNGWAIPDISTGNSAFYVYIRFGEPERLRFTCNARYVPEEGREFWDIRPTDSETLEKTIDLGSEEVHFFSRSLSSQIAILEEFVSTCLLQTTYETAQQEAD